MQQFGYFGKQLVHEEPARHVPSAVELAEVSQHKSARCSAIHLRLPRHLQEVRSLKQISRRIVPARIERSKLVRTQAQQDVSRPHALGEQSFQAEIPVVILRSQYKVRNGNEPRLYLSRQQRHIHSIEQERITEHGNM